MTMCDTCLVWITSASLYILLYVELDAVTSTCPFRLCIVCYWFCRFS